MNEPTYNSNDLWDAIKNDSEMDVWIILGCDVDPNVGRGPNTPLHRAVEYGDVGMVWRILVYGGNKDALDSNGRTPLQLAVHLGKDKIAHLLDYARTNDVKHATAATWQEHMSYG
jgi:ankyrin repeat protein